MLARRLWIYPYDIENMLIEAALTARRMESISDG